MEKMTREMGGTEGDVDGGEIAVESGGKGTAAAAKTRPAAALSFLEEINERKKEGRSCCQAKTRAFL